MARLGPAATTAAAKTWRAPDHWQGGRFEFPSLAGSRWLQVHYEQGGCHLQAESGRGWFISRTGSVRPVPSNCGLAQEQPGEEAIRQGPVEVLARAMRGQFCLHASAILVKERGVVAFVGESGVGKSTLARLIHERGESGWQRVADDVLPVWLEPQGIAADLSFPQPKLTRNEQEPAGGGEGKGFLQAVYLLEGPDGGDAVTSERCRPFDAIAVIAGNTMGARLFDWRLLDAHLGFCAAAAALVDVRRLRFPRQLGIGGRIISQLATDLTLPSRREG